MCDFFWFLTMPFSCQGGKQDFHAETKFLGQVMLQILYLLDCKSCMVPHPSTGCMKPQGGPPYRPPKTPKPFKSKAQKLQSHSRWKALCNPSSEQSVRDRDTGLGLGSGIVCVGPWVWGLRFRAPEKGQSQSPCNLASGRWIGVQGLGSKVSSNQGFCLLDSRIRRGSLLEIAWGMCQTTWGSRTFNPTLNPS